MADWYFSDTSRPFLLFGDERDLSMEPIEDGDLAEISVRPDNPWRAQAWSAACQWYFLISDNGIDLLNVFSNTGWRCTRFSARFIEMFLDSKMGKRKRAGAGDKER